MKNKDLVTISVSNYNGNKYIKRCLSSIKRSNYSYFEVIIIDDASEDKSPGMIKKVIAGDKRFKLYVNKKNLGLTVNRNRAIKMAQGKIIIFLDNDTEVDNGWIEPILKTFDKSNDVGACQSKLVEFEDRHHIQMAGLKLMKQTGWGLPIAMGDKVESYTKVENIISLGAALSVRKSAALVISGFDEKIIHYTDDMDFSWRLWISGYKIVSCPDSIVYHYSKPASDQRIPRAKKETIYYHLARNSFRSIISNYELINVILYLPMSIMINLFRGLVFIFIRKDKAAIKGTMLAILWSVANIRDTIKKRNLVQRKRVFSDRHLMDTIFWPGNIFFIYKKFFRISN